MEVGYWDQDLDEKIGHDDEKEKSFEDIEYNHAPTLHNDHTQAYWEESQRHHSWRV